MLSVLWMTKGSTWSTVTKTCSLASWNFACLYRSMQLLLTSLTAYHVNQNIFVPLATFYRKFQQEVDVDGEKQSLKKIQKKCTKLSLCTSFLKRRMLLLNAKLPQRLSSPWSMTPSIIIRVHRDMIFIVETVFWQKMRKNISYSCVRFWVMVAMDWI